MTQWPLFNTIVDETVYLFFIFIVALFLLSDTIYLGGRKSFLDKTGKPKHNALSAAVGKAVVKALKDAKGDVLVFLPGVAEIRR